MKIGKLFLLGLFFIGIYWNVMGQPVEIFPQMGHTSTVNSIALSPDGKQIVTGSDDRSIKLWDLTSGRLIKTFTGDFLSAFRVRFSPDGRQIYSVLSVQGDNVHIWDINSGQKIRSFRATGRADFSADGRYLITCDSFVRLYDIATGQEVRNFPSSYRYNDGVSISYDGRQALTRINTGTGIVRVTLWDVDNGNEIRTWNDISPSSTRFSYDGRQFLMGFNDGSVKLYDIASGREIRSFKGKESNYSIADFSPDGTKIITGSDDGTIQIWDITSGRETGSIQEYFSGISFLSYSLDGSQIYAGYGDGTVIFWDANSRRVIKTLGFTSSVNTLDINNDGSQIISGDNNNTLSLWDINNGREIMKFMGSLNNTTSITTVRFSSNGRQILSGSSFGNVILWDTVTGRDIMGMTSNKYLYAVSFRPDGRHILTGDSGSIKLWDITNGRLVRTIRDEVLYFAAAFSYDGRKAVGSWYNPFFDTIDIDSGSVIENYDTNSSNTIFALAFSPNGRNVLSGAMRGDIRLWDITTGRQIRTFQEPTESGDTNIVGINSVAFSNDGNFALSGSNIVKLWNINTGQEIRSFTSNTSIVNTVCFSPDGRKAIAGYRDGTIIIWDIPTGREIVKYIGFTDGEWIVLTPDGYYNASPNGDKHLNVRVGNNVYGIDQYRSTFYRPQIVEARLQGRPDPIQVTTTIQQAGEPPVVVIRSPDTGTRLTNNRVELSVVVESRQPVRNIHIIINGRLVSGNEMRGVSGIRGVELEAAALNIPQNQNRVEFRVPLTLEPGNNRIEVIANNPHEGRDSIEVFNQQAATLNTIPNLWILSIGVNRYDSPLLTNLNYAVNDAREIINVFKAQEGRVYRQVNSRLIADGTPILPTADNIRDGFDFLKGASPNDVILLFIAGHGLLDENGSFFFMPSDAAFSENGAIRSARAISFREIQSVLEAPGQKIVFIDACHSAGGNNRMTRVVDNSRLVRDLESHGTVILASSKGDQTSLERSDLRHGVFTYAILQGMRGEAHPNNGVISMTGLQLYVSNKVKELTNNAQEPTFGSPGYTDFPVARVR